MTPTLPALVIAVGLSVLPRVAMADDPPPFARLWVGVSASADVTFLPYVSDVCALTNVRVPANALHYYCTNPNGTDFPSRQSRAENDTLVHGEAGHTKSAWVPGNLRFLVSVDRALDVSTLVGIRVGLVTHGYPGSAGSTDGRGFSLPLHFEARGTRLFGDAPLARTGFAPLLLVDVGIAEIDAGRTVHLRQTTIVGDRPKEAWLLGGPFFVGAGGGFRFAFSPRIAITGVTRIALGIGNSGVIASIVPEVALQCGF